MEFRTLLLWCLLGGTFVQLPALAQDNQAANAAYQSSAPVSASSPQTEVLVGGSFNQAAGRGTETIGDTAFSGHDLSPWGMYQAADIVVKTVMIGLLLASVLTWAVWLLKTVQLRLARRRAQRLLTQLVQSNSFARAHDGLEGLPGDALLLAEACRHELELSCDGPTSDEGLKERVVARLERVQASLVRRMSQGTGMLATIGSVAPFVGLFGTVWGIMHSFIGIAQTQTTNLAVVAPGIAEALLATAIGLVAAIPAVVIYNYFSRTIGNYRAVLSDIATAILVLISRDLDRHHPQARPMDDLITAGKLHSASLARGTH
ncbi:tonB-system energizer ExbB [Microbulbifer sp. 2304DJ12-6]|uniref:tonB-system energizer ExbB n=1 Tax=Microbulbifer sp. 2304DJ12-6 TaxID=3233340 RepID=UPI0039AF0EFC